LKYICGIDATGECPGRHIVEFSDLNAEGTNRKPAGAARLELFAELVPPDVEENEGIPRHPADLTGRPLYMGSFTRSPMEVEFPVSMSGPMRVVYWGRWADAKGKWGPFSEVCTARLEGGNPRALPQTLREAAVKITDVRVRYIYVQAPHLLPVVQEMKRVGPGIAGLPQLEAATTVAGLLTAA